MPMENPARNAVRQRYDRIAPVYDLFEGPMEWLAMSRWRRQLIARLSGSLVLEAGVGTGKNLPLYPADCEVVAIDISEKMLALSRHRRARTPVYRAIMDVEALGFPEQCFDSVVATFLFCSVTDPVAGIRELRRVVKPNGQILLLEHVRPGNRLLGRLFDRLTPVTRNLFGPELNRDTVGNVRRAGLRIEEECNLWSDIVKLLICRR